MNYFIVLDFLLPSHGGIYYIANISCYIWIDEPGKYFKMYPGFCFHEDIVVHGEKEMTILKEDVFICIDLQKHETWCTMQQGRGIWGSTCQMSGEGRRRKKEREESMGLYCVLFCFVEKG